MKPDNIYRTLVGISPDLDSKEAWQIWRYIHDLLEDERKETVEVQRTGCLCLNCRRRTDGAGKCNLKGFLKGSKGRMSNERVHG